MASDLSVLHFSRTRALASGSWPGAPSRSRLFPSLAQVSLSIFCQGLWRNSGHSGAAADLHAVVVVRFDSLGASPQQGVAQLDQLQLEHLQGFELLFVLACAGSALVAQRGLRPSPTCLSLGSTKSLIAVYSVWLLRLG
jgi:hypothetical protein